MYSTVQIWIFAIDYPLALTILHQFLHPKAKKQSPTLPPALNVFISAVPAAAAVLVLFLAFAVRSTFPNGDRPGLEHDMHDDNSCDLCPKAQLLPFCFSWSGPNNSTSTVSLPWPTCLPLFLQSSAVEPHQNVKLHLSTGVSLENSRVNLDSFSLRNLHFWLGHLIYTFYTVVCICLNRSRPEWWYSGCRSMQR